MSAAVPLAQAGAEILANLLKIAASPQGLELIAKLLAEYAPDIAQAVPLKDAPPTQEQPTGGKP